MKRQPIQSSSIRTAGFEPGRSPLTGSLEIEFSSSAVYRYLDVPLEVWQTFLATDSKGSYFVCRIRDRFKFECIYRPSRKEKPNGPEGSAKAERLQTQKAAQRETQKTRIS